MQILATLWFKKNGINFYVNYIIQSDLKKTVHCYFSSSIIQRLNNQSHIFWFEQGEDMSPQKLAVFIGNQSHIYYHYSWYNLRNTWGGISIEHFFKYLHYEGYPVFKLWACQLRRISSSLTFKLLSTYLFCRKKPVSIFSEENTSKLLTINCWKVGF